MEKLNSRQNSVIKHFRQLSKSSEMRIAEGRFLCDGEKLLREAISCQAEIQCVMWKERRSTNFPAFTEEYLLTDTLYDYVSPLNNSPGPLFSVRMTRKHADRKLHSVLILEDVQDPGNVGTVIRTADALGTDAVVLLDNCADLYSPKTVRATMGAIFRQYVLTLHRDELKSFCMENGLKLWGAALSEKAKSIRELTLSDVAVAVGNEGRGLSDDLLKMCDGELIIPMSGRAESLNAAVAASILMWEMSR